MDEKTKNGLAVMAANYLKRVLEKPYDQIFATDFGRKLQNMDDKAKYLIEFMLNGLTAFFDQKLAGDTPLKRMIQEVGLDAAPEFSSRLLNGVKEELKRRADSPEERDLIHSLLQLDDEQFRRMMDWLVSVSPEERKAAIRQVSGLSPEELLTFIRLSPEDRSRIIELVSSKKGPAAAFARVSEELEKATTKVKGWTAKIKDLKNA